MATPPVRPATPVDDAIRYALYRTTQALEDQFALLPVPVRFRACGAVEAWKATRDTTGDHGAALSARLADTRYAPRLLVEDLQTFIAQHCTFNTLTSYGRSVKAFAGDCMLGLAFWARQGALYEPTPALHRLLEASDIASDLPLDLLRLPVPAMCVVPDTSIRNHHDGFEAVLIFEHGGPNGHDRDERWLTMSLWRKDPSQHGRKTVELLRLHVDKPAESIHQAAERLFEKDDVSQERRQHWRKAFNYVVKLLLYLSQENAPVMVDPRYSTASRDFPGLGRRKRAERLAAIESLYDRYVVGPAVLPTPASDGRDDCAGHTVRVHWRRGHFRLQRHGPGRSRARVVFIMPVIVRADLLALDGER